jgi:hypothetical protein
MDDRRFEELERKRFRHGLTREEADELGRMMAEKEGRPYSNADDRAHPDALTPEEVMERHEPEEAEPEREDRKAS